MVIFIKQKSELRLIEKKNTQARSFLNNRQSGAKVTLYHTDKIAEAENQHTGPKATNIDLLNC